MRKIKVRNNNFMDIKKILTYDLDPNLISNKINNLPEGLLYINMEDKYLVYQNDIGWNIMTKEEVLSYGQNLIEANPELYPNKEDLDFSLESIIYVIENTLDNEEVVQFI
jgi:hypothetical protein